MNGGYPWVYNGICPGATQLVMGVFMGSHSVWVEDVFLLGRTSGEEEINESRDH